MLHQRLGLLRILTRTYPKYRFCAKQEPIEEVKEEELHSEHIKKLEEQIKQTNESVQESNAILKQLETSNKENNFKIKELREVLKAELEEQQLQKKRNEKEKEQLKVFAITNFAKELLEVQDNLERAIKSTEVEGKTLLEGVQMTHNILDKVLKKFEINKMQSLGFAFNPNFHESLFQVEDAEKEPNSICYVAQDGYLIGERVLRPAKVGVVKQ